MWECDISRIDAKERWTCEIVQHQQWQAFPLHISDAIQDVYENGEANGVKFVVYYYDRNTHLSHVLTAANLQTLSSHHDVYEVDVPNRTQKNVRTEVVREIRRVVLT